MKKKLLLIIAGLLCLCLLAGCQCKHEWAQASCEAAKTCSKCGETEGEPLGHTWQEATCTAPRTCTVCGETQGKALAHTWLEANFQDSKTCQVCGKTEGEPLTADFEKYGLPINLYETKHTIGEDENGPVYAQRDPIPYVTSCYNNKSRKTTGQLNILNYRIFSSDETHPQVPGYEWRILDAEILFSDDNAFRYGITVNFCRENYYDITGWDDSETDPAGTVWEAFAESGNVYTVNYHGRQMPCLFSAENEGFGSWKSRTEVDAAGKTVKISEILYHVTACFCVPEGYDGVVFGFIDSSLQWDEGQYVFDVADENTLFFRMGNDPEQWWK